MDIDSLQQQERELIWSQFTADTALDLGETLLEEARRSNLPIVIDIRTADQTLFHAALPGATPLNDLWALRKSNAVLKFHCSSLLLGTRMRGKGKTFADEGLDDVTYANHGGSFPIRLRGGMVVAAVTVSGLPQAEDHALVVAGITHCLR
ncbi:heme-degrading domain-containing protein [Pseudorhodobacter sp.]|uniref:heme-degrading domain-containing protein n=1 Tax=Pseudorhodobacter sp. TaxID=1934400 RepID=UPI00264711A1|nr:heme-degrading domain-containing protein [Pseudorhodobacter sp.]MDN5788130.1 heme-degrading domain-containing protein [Pseudorhodobacter sp.]